MPSKEQSVNCFDIHQSIPLSPAGIYYLQRQRKSVEIIANHGKITNFAPWMLPNLLINLLMFYIMTAKTFVIDKPSKALVDLVNKLRERKIEKLEELKEKKDSCLKIKIA